MQTRVNFVWRCGFMRNTGSSFNSKPISRRYADSLPGAKVAATDSGSSSTPVAVILKLSMFPIVVRLRSVYFLGQSSGTGRPNYLTTTHATNLGC
ncbi:hypothetical protein, partial [Zoogloea oleivorans]|uniref:hypothetical protein n=1 Tax=Zoogloea oleivorans TaxID=1552750 RepID=UPI001CA3560D